MRSPWLLRPVLFFTALAMSVACATLPKKPDVALEAITVGKVSSSEVQMNVALKVTNPNDFAVKISGIDYKVNSLGRTLGEGQTLESLELKGKSSQIVSLPIDLNSDSVLQFAQAYLIKGGDMKVDLLGQVKIESPVALNLDFHEEKNLR